MDCQKTEFGLSAPALLKGIFYNENSRKKAWELLADLSIKERLKLAADVPVKGLKTRFKNKTIWEPACELVRLAEKGLGQHEAKYLWPLKEMLVERKKVPADILLECFDRAASSEKTRERIIDCAAI